VPHNINNNEKTNNNTTMMGENNRHRSHTFQPPLQSNNHQHPNLYSESFDPRGGLTFDGSWADQPYPDQHQQLLIHNKQEEDGSGVRPLQFHPVSQNMHHSQQQWYPPHPSEYQHYTSQQPQFQRGDFQHGTEIADSHHRHEYGISSYRPPSEQQQPPPQRERQKYHHEPVVSHPAYQHNQFPLVSTPGIYGRALRQPNFLAHHQEPDAFVCHGKRGGRSTKQEARPMSLLCHQTPEQQPPAQFYNGPPVSALVPRFARKATLTPHGHRMSLSSSKYSVGRSSLGSNENIVNGGNRSYDDVSPPPAPLKLEEEVLKPEQLVSSKTNRSPVVVRQQISADAENQTRPAPQARPDTSSSWPSMLPNDAASESSSPAKRPSSTTTDLVVESASKDETSQSQQEEDPPWTVPINFPKRLALVNDHVKLNALHCFLREKVLEIFVVSNLDNRLKFRHAPCSSAGRVGFRCKFCAAARLGTENSPQAQEMYEAPMAVFYPRTLSEIYRLVTSWQRCHVRKCKNMPLHLRKEWEALRHDKTRGKTCYWAESAHAIGLVDCTSSSAGIRFRVDAKGRCVGPRKQK
jgi:hypothetical protein